MNSGSQMGTSGPGDPASSAAVAALLRGYSLEITSRSKKGVDACVANLAPGTPVFIASIPGDSTHQAVATATKLAAGGFVPVPHLVARNISSFTQFNDFAARLRGEAGVTRALVVGGDAAGPIGPYGSALELLKTGALQKHGIMHIGMAFYAEPNKRVDSATLDQALVEKVAFTRQEGFQPTLISQFCFDAAAIVARVQRLRADGIDLPVRIGLAGPVDARTLWKYALHCGIGNSMRFLGARVDAISNLMVRHAPEEIMAGIVAAPAGAAGLGIEGVHIFAFGDVAGTAQWATHIREGSLRR